MFDKILDLPLNDLILLLLLVGLAGDASLFGFVMIHRLAAQVPLEVLVVEEDAS